MDTTNVNDVRRPARFFLTIAGIAVVLISIAAVSFARCSAASDPSSHGRGPFTEAEKLAMTTRSAPPPEAVAAMNRMNKRNGDPSAVKVVSPWAKPQP